MTLYIMCWKWIAGMVDASNSPVIISQNLIFQMVLDVVVRDELGVFG